MGRQSRSRRRTTTVTPTVPPPEPSTPSETRTDPPLPFSGSDAAICVALIVLVLAVFGQVLTHEFTTWDDPKYVYEEPQVRAGLTAAGVRWAFTTFTMASWHPLTWLSLMADVELFGLNAGAFAGVNLLLHLGATVLAWLALRELTATRWPAAFVAALFAIHPAHVESVAWIAARKDMVSGVFGFAALLVWAKWLRYRTGRLYAGFLLLYALCLLGKATWMVLPALLLLIDVWPLQRWSWPRTGRLLLEKVPALLIAVPVSVVAPIGQRYRGAMVSTDLLPLVTRIENSIISYLRYVWKFVWPVDLSFFYPYQFNVDLSAALLSAAVLIVISAGAIFSIRRAGWFFTGWFWFLAALSPVIGLFQSGMQQIADRYTYLPFVGLFIIAVWGAWKLSDRLHVPSPAAGAVGAVLLLVLAGLAFGQVGTWRDSSSLFTHAIAVTEHNGFAHFKLALLHSDNGNHAKKREHLRSAIEAHKVTNRVMLDDRRVQTHYQPWYSEALVLLGADLVEETRRLKAAGDRAGAEASLREAIVMLEEAAPVRKDSGEAKTTLAGAYELAGRRADADRLLQAAGASETMTVDGHLNLGAVLSRQGRMAEALEHFRAASRLEPRSVEPHIYLALGLANAGDLTQAIDHLDRARQLDEAAANRFLTNALRMPPRETNLQEFIDMLRSRNRQGGNASPQQ